ncbi:MAG: LysR family transcriptional regulator [Pseudomonadota bacterium]
MRLKQIEVFNAIMLTGSASGAAKLLHVSQPAVTQVLQHAEVQLGYALFTRQRSRLVPTREAQRLYPEVQRLVLQLDAVRRLAGALKTGAQDGLRVFIVPSLAVRALPDALRLFRRKHGEVPLSVRILHSAEIAQAIALQEGDVGIVYGSAGHPSLEEQTIATGRLVCISRSKAGDRRTTVALADVVREPFVRIDERDPLGTMLAEQFPRLGLSPRAGITVQTHHVAMLMAEEGFGPAIVDSFTAMASRAEGMRVRTVLPEVTVEVRALLPPGPRSRLVADFLKALTAVTALPPSH